MLYADDSVICVNNENCADLLNTGSEYKIESITHEGLVTLVGVDGLFCDWRFEKK